MKMRLDHVAVAVADIAQAVADFEQKLGLPCEKVESVPTEHATVAFFNLGGPHLELVAPDTTDSAMGRSLEKRGEGLHHICIEVEDIERALAALAEKGVRLVNESPVPGAGGSRVAFVHPKSMHGVLIELVQKIR
jgi:methylmalonyl-CoA/ethylmalonyl-CoA epimerase